MGTGAKIWVHIGLPKCGSTSIQRHFAKHDAHYLSQGLCYPVAGRSQTGYLSHTPITRIDAAEVPLVAEAIRQEAEGRSNVLISSETLSVGLPGGNLSPLIESLNRTFGAEQVHLLAYFRNVYQFVESSYAQFITRGLFRLNKRRFFKNASPDLESFVAAFESQNGFPIYSPAGYARLINDCFPDNRVIMKSIEKEDLNGASLIEDLCSTLDVHLVHEPKTQNARVPNLIIAAAHYAQCAGTQKAYNKNKEDIRKLQNLPGWDVRAESFHTPAFSIGEDLYNRIRTQIDDEKPDLPEFFASGTAGICENRWSPPRGDSELTEEEKAEIRDLLAQAIA